MQDAAHAPYGSWPSPLGPEVLAVSGIGLGQVAVDGDDIYWLERRPTEQGRQCVVRHRAGRTADALPPGWNARTLVHEYGGGDYTAKRGTLYFSNFADQRLYRVSPGGEPEPITEAPALLRGERFADLTVTDDGARLYCVRETHREGAEAVNELVVLPTDGSAPPAVIASGHDFYSSPTLDPGGTRLAWLTWDHPRMPWDGTELWEAPIGPDGRVGEPSLVAGGPSESIFQPGYAGGGDGEAALVFVSDRTGWWNLYRRERAGGPVEALLPLDAEFGKPQWVFGMRSYAVLGDGRIASQVDQNGIGRLAAVGRQGEPFVDLPYTAFGANIAAYGPASVVTVAASGSQPDAVVVLDLAADPPRVDVLKQAVDLALIGLDPSLVPPVEPIEFPTAGGRVAHALYYPPTNPAAAAPKGELPPLLVNSHGGPTAQTQAALSPTTIFWTSRGFGVVHVNYGGSTGYGRAYRERLAGSWGIVDVEDCAAAARYLAERGSVDPKRLAIRGGSAGGYTTLCALTFTDAFHAGVSFYGVADAAALAAETHKFESRYLDGLIGPYPDAAATYRERSPVHHTDRLSCPILLLQGQEDKVVPPSQAEAMAAALQAKGLPHAYLAFEGEAHGFRQPATIRRCAEAELSFYGQVFGFTPAGDVPVLPLEM